MKNQDSMSIAMWTAKSEKILENVRNSLGKIGVDLSGMPQEIFESNRSVSLVFAGQYSAGKSTILKALTGIEDIAIGAGITTQEAHFYNWNGIEIIDTPGIHTTLRPDHDEIAYQAIANADMLVYVVTQELFDDFIGQNFRRLLLEKDKAGEMILLVNKMADIGNTLENQTIKLLDLEKVTEPYTPAQLRTVFVDAESYIDSLSESDTEIAEELRTRSNYELLVSTLDSFVRDKGIPSQMTTVLYRLFEYLQKVLIKYQPSTGNDDIDALEEHLLQERYIISNTQWRIESTVKAIFEEAAAQIREKGRETANAVYNHDNAEDANEAITVAYNKVDEITSACVESITKRIEELSEDCQSQLDEFYNSDFSRLLKFRLEGKIAKENPIVQLILKSDAIAQGSKGIVNNTIGNAARSGLGKFSGSNMHDIVLKVGHFFGHKFKPWEAVKLTKGLNVAGKVLGVFGIVFSLGMQVKEDIDNDKRQQEMRKNREELRAGFSSAANELIKHFNNALGNFIAENYQTRISEIDSQISEIRTMRLGKSETCKMIEAVQDECRLLISEIHQSCSGNE